MAEKCYLEPLALFRIDPAVIPVLNSAYKLQNNSKHQQKVARIGTKGNIIRNKWLQGGSKGGNAIYLCKWIQPYQCHINIYYDMYMVAYIYEGLQPKNASNDVKSYM